MIGVLEKPVKVTILDNEYLIKSEEEDIEKVYKIARYVDDKVKEINSKSEGLSEKKAIILAALNITGDYFQVIKEREDLIDSIRQRSKALVGNIDSLMK